MTIQRQYTLPNCNLVLEGLSTDEANGLSPMSALMNVECHLPGVLTEPLTGGREFLEDLIRAVSQYAQQILSGVTVPLRHGEAPPPIEFKPGEGPYHHMLLRQPTQNPPTDIEALTPRDIKLNIVQFFDLLDAVDQLLADSQTLPDLAFTLAPVSRRSIRPAEPVAKRAAPAVIGASALAAAALGLFFVPPPEFEPSSRRESNPAAVDTASATATGSATATDEPPIAEGETESEIPQSPDQVTATDADISDPDLLTRLQDDLASKLREQWDPDTPPTEPLTYRVSLSADGDVLGYKYENDAALNNVDSTPLPELAYQPVDASEPAKEPVAQLLVSFTPDREVFVSPLVAEPDAGEPVAAEAVDWESAPDNPVADRAPLEAMVQDLRSQVAEDLDPTVFDTTLEYRVRLTQDGDVLGYDPLDQAAEADVNKTPLPELVTAGDADAPQADFLVVITEEGVLQVSPWDGWPD